MPNIMTDFEHFKLWDADRLMDRRQTLIASAPNGDQRQQSDEVLTELLAIHRQLRLRGSAPKVSGAGKKVVPTLDAL